MSWRDKYTEINETLPIVNQLCYFLVDVKFIGIVGWDNEHGKMILTFIMVKSSPISTSGNEVIEMFLKCVTNHAGNRAKTMGNK